LAELQWLFGHIEARGRLGTFCRIRVLHAPAAAL
jgi:hypothetical protein